jgi:PAS domain S-box-containing protein
VTGSYNHQGEIERLRSYFDASSSGIFVYDDSGALVDVNATACRLHGRSRDEMLACEPKNFIAPESHTVFKRFFAALEAGERFHGEAIGLHKSGSRFFAEVEGRLIEHAGRRLYFSSVIDITARKALEKQLRRRQRLESVGQLAAGIAHDFNNLLTVIQGHASLALESLAASDIAEDLEAITTAAERASRLTQHLLAFSSQQPLSVQPIDLCILVDKQVDMLKRVFPENIEISVRHSSAPCTVDADPALMEQVLMNLCLNAKQAMPDGGELLIEVRTDSGGRASGSLARQVLRVMDTGIGMDETTQSRIFEPFFTTQPRGIGTGLGLAMVHGAVHQHEGEIDVLSVPGKGTEFVIRLPPSRRVTADSEHRGVQGHQRGLGELVLIVEDDPDVSRAVAGMVRGLNYSVETASCADEALRTVAGKEPAIALLDLMLADGDGTEVLVRLRERYPRLKAIFMSGYAESEVRRRIADFADVHCLLKPLKQETLGRELRRVLRGRGA